jgi:hypothetical protein
MTMAHMSSHLVSAIENGARDADFVPEDAITMVSLLARRRRQIVNQEMNSAVEFGGKVLCFIFDPVKSRNTAFVHAMRVVREPYRGIFLDPELQDDFEGSLSKEFLRAPTIGEAVELGARALFVQRFFTRGA